MNSSPDLFAPLSFANGRVMKNRFMLAPLTNTQSHQDGRLSDEEFHWLTMRAKGGFAITTTCASHVQRVGQGFPGQLGNWSEVHLEGLSRLATAIKAHGSLAIIQLHHAGMRAPPELIQTQPVASHPDAETGSRALSAAEVIQLREDFITAAVRAEKAGFDGVEIHGAHGYILTSFLSPENAHRTDGYGGSLANRARIIREIIDGVRARCRPEFVLGVRLSAERYGLRLGEMLQLSQELMTEGKIDFLDVSLWDCFKQPEEAEFQGKPLINHFAELKRGSTRLGAAGKIMSAADARAVLAAGCDFAIIGKAGVLHHDFPEKVRENPNFASIALPVTRAYLASEGLSPPFIVYMNRWKGFVANL